jgi:hypothetical protein
VKILLACQQSPHRYPIPDYAFWRTYFVEGLREAGHEVFEIPNADWARGLVPQTAAELARWRDEIWTRTLAAGREIAGLDLFLGYLYPEQIEPAAVRELRATGVPTVHFFCDNIREFRRLPDTFAPFDLHWVPEHDALPLYAARGWPACFAPMPCWVPPALRRPPAEESLGPTFVGSSDQPRRALFAAALAAGLEVELRGPGWLPGESAAAAPPPLVRGGTVVSRQLAFIAQHGLTAFGRKIRDHLSPPPTVTCDFSPHVRPAVWGDEYFRVLRECRVCLGVNRFPSPRFRRDRPGRYSRLRDIEAPMLGACYLTEWAPELPQLYEPGREIEIYRDATELAGKTRALLADPSRRRALRLAGQRRALADHTVGASLARITSAVGV